MLKEKISIVLSIILLAVLYSFTDLATFPKYLGIFALLILASVFVKKVAGYYMEIDANVETWEFQRYWFSEKSKFKNKIPIGLLLPILLYIFSYQTVVWLATLQTNFKARLTKKILKKKGKSMPDVKEIEIAWILFFSTLSSIIIAIASFPFALEITTISLLYALYNLIPIGKLDGTKLLFSSRIVYFITISILALVSIVFGILQL